MTILATKEESATRTILEIEVPADEVEKAFGAVTRRRYSCRSRVQASTSPAGTPRG